MVDCCVAQVNLQRDPLQPSNASDSSLVDLTDESFASATIVIVIVVVGRLWTFAAGLDGVYSTKSGTATTRLCAGRPPKVRSHCAR